jgi:hypothetical protein
MTAMLIALALVASGPGVYPIEPGASIKLCEIVEPAVCWPINYDKAQAACAEAGGMKLHRLMRERPGDWLLCVVYPDTEQAFALTASDTLLLAWPDGRTARSIEAASTDDPAERTVQSTRAGVVCLWGNVSYPTKSGGGLLLVRYASGSLPRERGKLVLPSTVERRP